MSGGAGTTAAAAAAAARRRRRKKTIEEFMSMFEPIDCPLCGRGKLLPLFSERSTNWVCSQQDCTYMIHQHGTQNTKVWKGAATKEQPQLAGGWQEAP